jgi:hypothetical protein
VTLTGVYKNMRRGVVALVFRCTITGGELVATDEAEDSCWADEDGVRRLAAEAYAIRVLDAMRNEPGPAIRHHDGVHLL